MRDSSCPVVGHVAIPCYRMRPRNITASADMAKAIAFLKVYANKNNII